MNMDECIGVAEDYKARYDLLVKACMPIAMRLSKDVLENIDDQHMTVSIKIMYVKALAKELGL